MIMKIELKRLFLYQSFSSGRARKETINKVYPVTILEKHESGIYEPVMNYNHSQ